MSAAVRFVPFVPGRRPEHEAAHPGLGSSEAVSVILPGSEQDPAYLLYTLPGARSDDLEVRATVSLTGPDGDLPPRPVPGWEDRLVPPLRFVRSAGGAPELRPAPDRAGRLVLALPASRELLDVACDPFGFEHRFSQQLRVELRVRAGGEPAGAATAQLLVCDLRRSGSLYARLLERLVAADAERQAAAAGLPGLDVAYHPWFPVLLIGSDKAALYTRALVEDIARAGRHLADPGWLVRVGLYLELLTFLGICEAVRDDAGDLLSPAERAAFELVPAFAELRARVNPQGWREVWEERAIALRRFGTPSAGPVSALNLLAKKRATLRFLHVHHEDLKHAIELAGRNHHNAQETWHRVFRDAERAVLRNIPAAFPELAFLPEPVREQVLWHRGVQPGLFASACRQYRASMNSVAAWAKARGLMDHTGRECVPRQVSLLEAHVNQPPRVALLQRHDGYEPTLDGVAEPPERYMRPAAELPTLLAAAPLFAELDPAARAALVQTARPLTLGPAERLLVEGHESSRSLYLLAEGRLEVLTRDEDGHDRVIDAMEKGAIVGEMSLLTGAPYSATVRAAESAVVYEIGAVQHDPLLSRCPEIRLRLQAIMDERWSDRPDRLAAARRRERALGRRLRTRLAGD